MSFISLDTLARVLALPRGFLQELARDGAIPSLEVGGRMRFEPDAVREALRNLAARPGRDCGEPDDAASPLSTVAPLPVACPQTDAPPLACRIGADEPLVTLTEASHWLPRIDGRKIAVATLWRWCRKGLRGVRLEYVRVGRRICTTHGALLHFFHALSSLDEQTTQPRLPSSRPKRNAITSRQRLRALADADAVLERARI
jgi:excisionase family DNA binding protein